MKSSVKNVSKCKKLSESPPENIKKFSKSVKSATPQISENAISVKQRHLSMSLDIYHTDDVTCPLKSDFSEIVRKENSDIEILSEACKENSYMKENYTIEEHTKKISKENSNVLETYSKKPDNEDLTPATERKTQKTNQKEKIMKRKLNVERKKTQERNIRKKKFQKRNV